jgi:hypothetical protein
MNPQDLSSGQLRRAAAIKDQIDALASKLNRILGSTSEGTSPDAEIQRSVNGGSGFLVVARAVEFRHSHAAQAERRDGQSLGSQFSLFHTQVVAIGKIQFADKLKPNPDLTRINFEGLTHPLNRSISWLTILLGRD